MAANKNGLKIGLRIFAAVTLIYLVYHLIPTSSYPLTSKNPQPKPHPNSNPYVDTGFGGGVGVSSNPANPLGKPNVPYSYEDSTVPEPHPFPGNDHDYPDNVNAVLSTSAAAAPTKAAPAKIVPTAPSSPSQKASKWTSTAYNDPLLPTPVKHLTLTNTEVTTSPNLLVCVMTKDEESWGSNDRNFSSFLSMLEWTELPTSNISLAFLTSSEEEYETYRTETINTDYASVHVMLHPGYQDFSGTRGNRHAGSIQHARRVEMARLRNYATLTSLQTSHQHILWIDADVYEISTGLFQSMLNFSNTYPQVGIQTAISLLGDGEGDYDWNAWQGERSTPDEKEREKLRKDKGSWTASSLNGKSKHMGDLRKEFREIRDTQRKLKEGSEEVESGGAFDPSKAVFDEDEDEPSDSQSLKNDQAEQGSSKIKGLFRLDAVGATVLMMKASLWRQGLSFATSYLVGTDWKDEGWDGVESEGLCVMARNLINEEYGRVGGVGCWGVVEGYTRHSSS